MTKQRSNQYKQLGLTIAYYRKLKGITQQALAEAVNLSRTHISNLEAPNMPTSISLIVMTYLPEKDKVIEQEEKPPTRFFCTHLFFRKSR